MARILQIDGDGAAVTVPFTAPASLPALPSSPATLEALMTMLASMSKSARCAGRKHAGHR